MDKVRPTKKRHRIGDYYPDSRKRTHDLEYSYEKGLYVKISELRSLDYGRFQHIGL